MSTPHINAHADAFAETCLLPGDPLRAKYIADNFLTEVTEVTNVRNMLGYTGRYKGQPVSVMGTGMGIPSCTIYTTELVQKFGVKKLIRVGSCGSVNPDIHVRDIILAQGACTDSGVNRQRFGGYDFAAIADFDLLRRVANQAESQQQKIHVGNVFTSDLFYQVNPNLIDTLTSHGVMAIEMEAAGLYSVAAAHQVAALTILTVSDHVLTGEEMSATERQEGFSATVELALEGTLI